MTNAELAAGGYALHEPPEPVATVIATGSEVALTIAAAATLAAEGKPVRVVSMPCIEQFKAQPIDYQERVVGRLPVFAVEMGRPEIWCQFTGSLRRVIGIEDFGRSGPAEDVAEYFGFTPAQLAKNLGEMIGPPGGPGRDA
jgi:transketolase